MPASTTAVPKTLRPYLSNGVHLDYTDGEQAKGDCPFCGREGKFSVNVETGQWRCFVCNEGTGEGAVRGGNAYVFLRLLYDRSFAATGHGEYSSLAVDRGVDPETLIFWGVARSVLTREWIVPGYSPDNRIVQLYRYAHSSDSGKNVLKATAGLGHGVFGVNLYSGKRESVYVCESLWDAMALWEVLRTARVDDDTGQLVLTASESASLLSDVSVVATAGCTTWHDSWSGLVAGKRTVILFHSDHPKEVDGVKLEPAGYAGARRLSETLAKGENRPAELHYLEWGKGGYDPSQPSGYDARDVLKAGVDSRAKVELLEGLLHKVVPVPAEWIPGRSLEAVAAGEIDVECLPCDKWSDLIAAWRLALYWNEGLERALATMLAVVVSTKSVGEQLWAKVVGPPSSGKTILCEALSVNRQYIYPKDTVTSLTSGYQVDRDGSENLSLVDKLRDKTLVINDGDTILRLPNRDQVLSQFRAFYGRNLRTQYGNRMSANHESISATIILCGTENLRELDTSELGERFVDCRIVDEVSAEDERAVALRVAYRAAREVTMLCDGKPESREAPEMVRAKQLTGGYVGYLRANAQDLLSQVQETDADMERCVDFGEFISFMRARPSKRQTEKAQRELCYRLVSQWVRMAKCMAVVLNKTVLDARVMGFVRSNAIDTARGRTLDLAVKLYGSGAGGSEAEAVAYHTGHDPDEERGMLKFLKRIGATENFAAKVPGIVSTRRKWRLTSRLRELYRKVMVDHANGS